MKASVIFRLPCTTLHYHHGSLRICNGRNHTQTQKVETLISNPEIRILLEIDDEWMYERRKRGLCLYMEPDGDYSRSIIVMTKEIFEQLYYHGKGMPGIWHEIGHYHTSKYFFQYLIGEQEKMRSNYIKEGKIPPAEYVADLFSYYAERDEVFDWFKSMIRARYKLIGRDNNALMAWNELRDRRDALKRIKTDEEIEKELCRVCGVDSIEKL